jgi:uncharacterized protein HemX
MKTGHKIVIYSFIVILILYSIAITGYMVQNIKNQYYKNQDIQQELYNANLRMDTISKQQNLQYQENADLKIAIQDLAQRVNNIAPQADKIAYYQVSTLIGTANSSLLLQDTKTTLALLHYVIDFIENLHRPMFAKLKISILEDITYLESNKDYDDNFILVKIDALNHAINDIFSNRLIQVQYVHTKSVNDIWHKFINNAKNTLFHFWEKNVKQTNNDNVLYNILQLQIMNLKHALLTHDQNLWNKSVSTLNTAKTEYALTENEYNLLLPYIKPLEYINVAREKNLSHTMNTMNELSNYIFNQG